MSKPAHKQDDPAKSPGQVVNDIPAYSYKPSHGGRPDVTLGDYPARKNWHDAFDKVAEEMGLKKKSIMSFDEWYQYNGSTLINKNIHFNGDNYVTSWTTLLREVWKAAQENV